MLYFVTQTLIIYLFYSSTTGLVEQASSRHLDNANGTITLDELASNGSFIPRPEYTNGQKYWSLYKHRSPSHGPSISIKIFYDKDINENLKV